MAGVRQFDEEHVLAQALELFWRQGYRGTSMLDLAAATGVQRGSLYNAYGDKEALFLLVFDRYAARFLATARAALDDPDPACALTRLFEAGIANMTAGMPAKGCLSTKTAAECQQPGGAVHERVRDLLDALEAAVRDALTNSPGRARLAIPPEAAARVVVTFTRGLAVMERVHGDPARLADSAAALVAALVRKRVDELATPD